MRRAHALLLVAALVGLTALALLAPWPVPVALALAAFALLRRGRGAFLAFALLTLALNALVLGIADGRLLSPTREGALAGLAGGARLVAVVGANLAALARWPPARVLDALALPPRLTGLLAAVLLAAQDARRDFERLRLARRLDGAWPAGRLARARAAAALLPPLLVAAHRRAQGRRDALRLAGHDLGAWFVPVVAIAALAAAGRLAFLALPNVALTFVVVFLGGLLHGPWRAMAGAALGMALTDLLLTGLHPLAFVNVPAMALVALLGVSLRGLDFSGASRADRAAGTVFAAFFGLVGTFAFSVAADAATWLLLYADRPEALAPLVLAGLAFNALPALVNAVVFAASVGPTARAFRALRQAPAPARPPTRAATEPDAAPTPNP